MRPCQCDRVTNKGGVYVSGDCAICWYWYDPGPKGQSYRASWAAKAKEGEPQNVAYFSSSLDTSSTSVPLSREKPVKDDGKIKICLVNKLCPSDIAVSTMAIESLVRFYPVKYSIAVKTTANEIFLHNPYIVETTEDHQEIILEHPLIQRSCQEPIHFGQAYADYLGKALSCQLCCVVNKPIIYLSNEEMAEDHPAKGKWLINAGFKTDFTVKHYPHWQQVVNYVKDYIKLIQIGTKDHVHMPLQYCENWIDKTTPRELIKAVYHCRGVIGPESYTSHLAAAFDKPCVTVAGGRIPQSWTAYPKQTFLHTIGCLPCSQIPCWRSRVIPLQDGNDLSLCSMPASERSAKCMDMITPIVVACAILKYEGWTLDDL